MKVITIRELHAKTGELVRQASRHGEILVTDNGRRIAKIVPETGPEEIPYFARRKFLPGFEKLQKSGKLGRGADSTKIISEEREDRADSKS